MKVLIQETGKLQWDAESELAAMIAKIDISIQSYSERCPSKSITLSSTKQLSLTHRSHGVLVVIGPYNFPLHLPNGHIVPALIAGNTIIFKPSPHTPKSGELMVKLWIEAGLPSGVLSLVQGESKLSKALCKDPGIDGVLFTGSQPVGHLLAQSLSKTPEKILALEMGGNNPMIVYDVKSSVSVFQTIAESSFISTGQRCTCTRRLILVRSSLSASFLNDFINYLHLLPFNAPSFFAPLISNEAVKNTLKFYKKLVKTGSNSLLSPEISNCFITPAVVEHHSKSLFIDHEIFGPLLQVTWVDSLDDAIQLANQTRFGLSASILSRYKKDFMYCKDRLRAGILNWNLPSTGASSQLPFGGVGWSGNNRPSAFYAADYCAYPISSIESKTVQGSLFFNIKESDVNQ